MLSKAEVIDSIRSEIRARRFVPGQRLIESDLCNMFQSSRGTVRAALMDLAAEGLIERTTNRGARIRSLGLEEALHISEVRMTLECLCVARVVDRITDEQIATFQEEIRQLEALVEADDDVGFRELTGKIREQYLRIADQPAAYDVIKRLRDQMIGHRYRLSFRPGRMQASMPFWRQLIGAFARRDAEMAQTAIRDHAANVQEAMVRLSRSETQALVTAG